MFSWRIYILEQSSGELCGQENKANAKLARVKWDVCLATGELIA